MRLEITTRSPSRVAANPSGEEHLMARRATNSAEQSIRVEETNMAIESADHDHVSGRGWHGDPEGHAAAGRKGGRKVSQNRDHMAEIGRRGGSKVSQDRSHMA